MQRQHFIDAACDFIAAGRREHRPDIPASEEAMARMKDMRVVAKVWAKHRESFRLMRGSDLLPALQKLDLNS